MVLAQVVSVVALVIGLLWILSLFLLPIVSFIINVIIIFCFGLRSLVEIDKGFLEHYIFFGLLVSGFMFSINADFGLVWPLSYVLVLTFAGVRVYTALEPLFKEFV